MPLNMTGVITALAASRQSDGVSQEDKTRALIFGGYGGPIAGLVAGENAVSRAELQQARQQVSNLQKEVSVLTAAKEEEEQEDALRLQIRQILNEELGGAPSGDGSSTGNAIESAPGSLARSTDRWRELETMVDSINRIMHLWQEASPHIRRQVGKSHSGLAEALDALHVADKNLAAQKGTPEAGVETDAKVGSGEAEPTPAGN